MEFYPAYWEEPGRTEFESEVTKVQGRKVILKNTYFHPEEGGQPADKGTLNGNGVKDVQKEDGEIIHYLDQSTHDLTPEENVHGDIDEDFRHYCMRAHTGAHVVYGAGREVLGDIDYSGFDIGEKKVRIDFETEAHVDKEKLLKLEELSNQIILEDRPVRWKFLDREEIEDSREVAFAKEVPEGERVRIIEIEDWDIGVCSGTHLENTLEVGRIHVLGKKKLQEGVTRIRFCVGRKALKRDYREKRSVQKVLRSLQTNPLDLPEKVRKLQERLKEMGEKLEKLEREKIERKLENFDHYGRENYDLLIQTLSTSDTEMLSHKAKDEVKAKEVMVIVNQREKTSVVVGVGESVEDIEADGIINMLSEEFGGGGGGTSRFAQGGGFNADHQKIRDLLLDNF